MCGITGLYDLRERRTVDRELLARQTDALAHRGPDAAGLHIDDGIGLGHRRLSIIDVAAGQQPLYNEDGKVVVVFNGEIYNYRDLVPELEALGHVFHTRSDTEVIVHAWEAWGTDCLQRFRGMFAFAVWDQNRQCLFLARDRLGVKPLYFGTTTDGWLVFGSELKALLLHPRLPRTIDPAAVEEYLAYGYVPEPRSILQSVGKLEPGHYVLLERGRPGQPRPRRYWDVPFQPSSTTGEADLCRELLERMREAVAIRLVAEVPLGAFLSGGVDSSAVVALMAGLDPKPVQTCSIGFHEPRWDESRFARMVAGRYGTDHVTRMVTPEDMPRVDELAAMYDEPFADSSALPTSVVCALARERVTVALSGDGGDEAFAGYRRYRFQAYEERLRSFVPAGLRRPLFGLLARLYPKADWAPRFLRARATFAALSRDATEGYFHSVSIIRDAERFALYTPGFRRRLGGHHAVDVMRRHAANSPTDHPLSLVQYLDYKTYIPGDILTKVDRASMAHGLEVRVPLLDHKLVEWASGVDPEWKLRDTEGKYILKRALEPSLPREVLYREKMGFAVPLVDWFRGPLAQRIRDVAAGDRLAGLDILDRKRCIALVDAHQSGLRDASASLWTILMLDAAVARLDVHA